MDQSPGSKQPSALAPSTADAETTHTPGLSRRGFLRGVGGASALAAGGLGAGASLLAPATAAADPIGPLTQRERQIRAYQVRVQAARNLIDRGLPPQPCNGDEDLYDDYRASFFKCLPQNDFGEVDVSAYQQLLQAISSGEQSDFDAVPLSGLADRRLANTQAAYAFEMTGGDGHSSRIPAAPAFASALQAAEMVEVYWQALVRDVPFAEYDSDPTVAAAVADMNALSVVVGPTENGQINASTLFRGETPGDLVGPYLSQLMWLDVPYGLTTIVQKYAEPAANVDFLTDTASWLACQRGTAALPSLDFDPTPRYLHDNRSLGEWVHQDFTFQGYLNAGLIMLGFGPAAVSDRNPYSQSFNQGGFITFGAGQLLDLVAKAASVALKAAWYQKWLVHRQLRPEVFAARAEFQRAGTRDYGLHPDLLASDAASRLFTQQGNVHLPLAYPEGSPTHPSYPAGHACVAGACCTMLKAFFNESFVVPEPVVASSDGLTLDSWTGDDLTLGNEINKLAANISIGRDAAGVHYRSDGIDGLTAGEQMAIGMLRDYSIAFAETADGFELTRFDGQRILVSDGQVIEL